MPRNIPRNSPRSDPTIDDADRSPLICERFRLNDGNENINDML